LKNEIDLNPIAASLLLAANLWESRGSPDEIVVMDRYVYSNIAYSTARVLLLSLS
jgi:thymidylate kinase